MRYRKPTHPITSDMHREISVAALAKAGAFRRPTTFPFQHLDVPARDHIRVFRVGDKTKQTPQIVAVQWRQLRFGMRPFFICSRCSKRRVYLYFDGLQAYCRVCADLWYRSQQVRRRTRLLHRSHRIRASLGGDQLKPGSPFPARPYLQTRQRYRRIIAKLRNIEDSYRHIVANDGRRYRERDEYGRYLPNEVSADSNATDDLGQ
jgi:hypothetical protein